MYLLYVRFLAANVLLLSALSFVTLVLLIPLAIYRLDFTLNFLRDNVIVWYFVIFLASSLLLTSFLKRKFRCRRCRRRYFFADSQSEGGLRVLPSQFVLATRALFELKPKCSHCECELNESYHLKKVSKHNVIEKAARVSISFASMQEDNLLEARAGSEVEHHTEFDDEVSFGLTKDEDRWASLENSENNESFEYETKSS